MAQNTDEPFNRATVRATWEAPCVGSDPPCGSPAVEYVLQLRYADPPDTTDWFTYASGIDTTHANVDIPLFVEVQARVAGVDAQDRQGVWSDPSDWYVADFGPPGAPMGASWVISPIAEKKKDADTQLHRKRLRSSGE
jgi:hypothetical protein